MSYFTQNHNFFIRTLWGSLQHADWANAWAQGSVLGLVWEFLRALVGFHAWPFFVPDHTGCTPATIQSLLHDHGIPTWGWGYAGGEHFFQVKMRQAHWAQFLLLQQGIALGGRLLDERARGYVPHARSRKLPASTQHSTIGARAPLGGRAMLTPQPVQANSRRDPLAQINHLVDRIAKW